MSSHPPTDDAPPELSIWVCVNRRYGQPSCAGAGSEAVADALERALAAEGVTATLRRTPCQGRCSRGPVVRLLPELRLFFGVSLDTVPAILDATRGAPAGAAVPDVAPSDPDAAAAGPNPLAPPWIFGQ